jgi:hypothetical protein
MPNTMQDLSVGVFLPMLTMLSQILDKGAEHMRAQGKNPDALVEAKLAPDMFPLSFQIGFACHQALSCLDMLTGNTPGQFASTNAKTPADLKAIIEKTCAKLSGVDAKALQGSEARKIEMPLQEPLYVEATGFDIVRAWILPNFYFHVVTAYDILRHNGVELGKRDYMGGILAPYIRQRG